jgi:Protein of unknown function (DUF1631)
MRPHANPTMNPPLPRLPPALTAAVQRIKLAAREAAQRCVDALGVAALGSTSSAEREDLLSAQFELNRKQSAFAMVFNERLDESLAAEMRRREGSTRANSIGSSWQTLSLVDDRQVEIQVSAERFALTLQHDCEWELRELDGLMTGLLHNPHGSRNEIETRNPLRPEVLGKAMVSACDAISERDSVRRAMAEQLSRAMASAMPSLYATIVEEMKAAGIKPPDFTVRSVQGPGNALSDFTNTGYDSTGRAAGLDSEDSTSARLHGGPSTRSGANTRSGASTRAGLGTGGGGAPSHATIGQVDGEVMNLIRRLAMLGNIAVDTQVDAAHGMHGGVGTAVGALPAMPNLILANREELRRTATGSLDHMVIDVVGSLFDQILADPKIPPQMARHIARLQLPVLRAALGDSTFFSSRRHPVRRLVNRMASLAVAFEDFSEGPGEHFLSLVRDLVDEIVSGDFDQMALYEQTLDKLETFVAEQAQRDVEANSKASSLLDQKETDLLLQQRFMQQLHGALAPVAMDDFLRQFLTQVWSQALMKAASIHGADSDTARRMRLAGRDLVMSVQPKGSPADRKAFLVRLPHLMKDLNEGIALIGWPEAAKKDFFDKLMPAHARSLKGESLRTLDFNLLTRQLDAILATPLPRPEDAVRGTSAIPVLDDVVSGPGFTPEEAARIGLVEEHAIDWNGEVDIEVGADQEGDGEVSALDINIEGLPAPEPVEPTRGASLADHVQIGFSYRMHFEDQWHKVRLSHISPGRTFFVFTRGAKHQHAISMTARMLFRLCETGRLRAFENAYLIERATARARKQLAAMGSGGGNSTSGVPLTTRL